jgi:hypothetical protein
MQTRSHGEGNRTSGLEPVNPARNGGRFIRKARKKSNPTYSEIALQATENREKFDSWLENTSISLYFFIVTPEKTSDPCLPDPRDLTSEPAMTDIATDPNLPSSDVRSD